MIIIDTREQDPFTFKAIQLDKAEGGGTADIPYRMEKLDYGDYMYEGVGGIQPVSVERKTLNDLWKSLTSERERFERKFQRCAMVVVESCEFSYTDCNLVEHGFLAIHS